MDMLGVQEGCRLKGGKVQKGDGFLISLRFGFSLKSFFVAIAVTTSVLLMWRYQVSRKPRDIRRAVVATKFRQLIIFHDHSSAIGAASKADVSPERAGNARTNDVSILAIILARTIGGVVVVDDARHARPYNQDGQDYGNGCEGCDARAANPPGHNTGDYGYCTSYC